MVLTGAQLIAGSESAEGPASFSGVDPRARVALAPRFHEATEGELERAMAASAAAADELRGVTPARRAAFLRAFAGLVEEGSWVDARIDRGDPGRTP
ncbi:MAG: hypothetical protein ACNA8N_09950, partial [Trueperaceae bacterium]